MNVPKKRIISFSVAAFLYTLLILWMNAWWFLFGNLILADIFMTRLIDWSLKKYSLPRAFQKGIEWTFFLLMAILISTTIKTLFVEAYKIPTPSMEGSLKAGDYIFVSKLSYGPKMPNTPFAIPLVPNYLRNGKRTYADVELPYKRLLGFSRVKRGDVIVSSFPEGDSVVIQLPGQNYYSLLRQYGRIHIKENYTVISLPVDRRQNYVKRCYGLPGDTVQISSGRLYVNHKSIPFLPKQKFKFYVKTTGSQIDEAVLDSLKILKNEVTYNPANSLHVMHMTIEQSEKLNGLQEVRSIQRFVEPVLTFYNQEIYPHNRSFNWTNDLFGPIIVPSKGWTIKLKKDTYPLYARIIEVYEKNTVRIDQDLFYINEKLSETYTFNMDYYFALGDNRHNSADSRHWGFIPEDHLLGKAVAIWWSHDPAKSFIEGIRKDRIFKRIK